MGDEISRIEFQPEPERRMPPEPPEERRSFVSDFAANAQPVLTSIGNIVAGGLILEMIKGGRGDPPPDGQSKGPEPPPEAGS